MGWEKKRRGLLGIFLVLIGFWRQHPFQVHAATVSMSVGGESSSFLEEETEICEFQGGEIVMSHPMSIDVKDTHYVLGTLMLKAAQMTVDRINMWPRCGLSLRDGKNYSLTLQTYGDRSDENKTARIGRKIVADNRTHFLLAGYSSSLTAFLTPIAQENRKLCITGGSSKTSVHAGKDYVFGLNPPGDAYLEYAFVGTAARGAKTVAFLAEDTASSCDGIVDMAAKYDMELLKGEIIEENAPFAVYQTVVQRMKESNPDLMITCVRTRLGFWNQAMREADWTPHAQAYTYVVGTDEFEAEIGLTDLPYIMGVSGWDSALPPIPDAASGWTPKDFDAIFELAAFRRPAYQQVQQSAVVSVLAQAIERVGHVGGQNATDRIRDVLATGYFPTVYGNVSFDANGQNEAPFLLLQYDHNSTVRVLLPEDKHDSDFEMYYPLPTWAERDCLFESPCLATGGACEANGTCANCPAPLLSQGVRNDATCVPPPPVLVANETSYFAVAFAIPLVVAVLVGAALVVYFQRVNTRHREDAIWKIRPEDLVFSTPPEIIGKGSFGLVLKAELHGTTVAVKRALPSEGDEFWDEGEAEQSSRRNDHGGKTSNSSFPAIQSTPLSASSFSVGGPRVGSKAVTKTEGLVSEKRRREEFIKEMRLLSKLRHPCVTMIMGAVVDSKTEPLMILEYMQRGSLYDILQNETMYIEKEMLLSIVVDIASGCRFLHARSPPVIHGDLKAANILVDSKFRAKVSDFGLSLANRKSSGITGTPFWMAPELLTHRGTNTKETDVYAFGILLYETVSRRDPYWEDEDKDLMQVLSQIADPVIHRRPPVPADCPPQLGSLMCDCLVVNPVARPSFEELDKRLQRIDVSSVEVNNNNLRRKSVKLTLGQDTRSTISLFDIFPSHIAEALRDGKPVQAEQHDNVTIFFSDIVGFTTISQSLEPRKVAEMLDRFYLKMDKLSEEHDIFKVETIGDAYVAVSNLVKDQNKDHATRIAKFSIDAIMAANQTLIDTEHPELGSLNIRCGFHCGPVVADVVGSRNPRFCLFGDSMNTASRMESNSKENRIHCSEAAWKQLQKELCSLPINPRGMIKVKGKGKMRTFWINEAPQKCTRLLEPVIESFGESLSHNISAAFVNPSINLSEAFTDPVSEALSSK